MCPKLRNNATLKGLKSQIKIKEGELDAIKIDMISKQKEYENTRKVIDEIKSRVKKLEHPNIPEVSEHAILRYLERVKELNIEEIEKEILNDDVLELIEKLGGSGKYPNNNGFRVVMKDNMVVTIEK